MALLVCAVALGALTSRESIVIAHIQIHTFMDMVKSVGVNAGIIWV